MLTGSLKNHMEIFLVVGLFACCRCSLYSAEPSSSESKDADHGTIQVTNLINDRPQLQAVVQKDNPIWKWMVDAFNYSEGGAKVYWDPGSTSKANNYSAAESETYQATAVCFIRADKTYKEGQFAGVDVSVEELLSAVVMELNNVRHNGEFAKLNQMAAGAKIAKDDYILGCARLEFKAGVGVNLFLENVLAALLR